MGGDRHGPKSGRYVGGFLQLFDWNAKSRKKLFPSKSDLPEQPKHGKQYEGNLPVTRIRVEDEEEFGGGLSYRCGSEYSYASSFTDDDIHGAKAPGVVARLMGLDSMPTYPSSFSDTQSLQDAPFRGRNLEFYHDHQVMHSSHQFDKVDSTRRNNKGPVIRPIEKFQREMLPPKSAKTIPITHHKLLSPIKRSMFVPSRDGAHVMAAAAKIIEPGPGPPQGATPRAKISSPGSSSVPFKIREMREKLKASQRPGNVNRQVESNAARCLGEQPMNKSTGESNDSSFGVKGKSKTVSLAIQAKVNVQRREGLTGGTRSFASEEQDDSKSIQSFRNQTSSSSKSSSKKSSTQCSSSVLRVNNQKQNCPKNRDKPLSKALAATSTGKKSVSEKGACRTSSRKSSLHARDGEKGTPYSGSRNVPRKKRSIDGSLNSNKNKNQATDDNVFASKKDESWLEESRRKGMDVVSFTFTAPMTRSMHVSEPVRQLTEKRSDLFNDDRSNKTLMNSDITILSSPGFNGIRGDALSVLLEQKLKELASNLGSPHSFVRTDTSVESAHRGVFSPGSESQSVRRIFNFQAGEATEECSSTSETRQRSCQLPSPVSTLESSTLTECCYSSESLASCSTEERKPCASVMETSDSASSTSSQTIAASSTWELGYVENTLCNIELMFKDYVTGRTREILNPCLFDQMEKRRGGGQLKDFNEMKLERSERRLLFDCVGECLDSKCQVFVGGGYKTWRKGVTELRRKERVAREIYKEVEGWRQLGNSNVDELVDKDMSSKHGRWLDFQVDEFMLGVDIGGQILDSLLVELVADLSRSRLQTVQ